MALVFRVEASDLKRAIKSLREKDAPFVMAYTLTKTAQDIEAAEIADIKSDFDRPTNYTLNSTFVKPATKRDLVAVMGFKDSSGSVPASRYLEPGVEGGQRSHKSHELRLIRAGLMRSGEFAVPGPGVKLDSFGNIPASAIQTIVGQVLAGAKLQAAGRYFVLRPGGAGSSNRKAAAGIYYRAGARDIVPVMLFVSPPRYSKRFPFYETARATFDARLLARAREGFDRFVTSRPVQNG